MEFNDRENENASPTLDFGDSIEPENNSTFLPEMENRLRTLLTELQMYRSGVYESKRFEKERIQYVEQISELNKQIENIKIQGQRAAAAAEQMVIERDAAINRLAVVEPALEALEKEKLVLEESAKNMFNSLESLRSDEKKARLLLNVNEKARIEAEATLDHIKQLTVNLEIKKSKIEEDLKLMKEEIQAKDRVQTIWKTTYECLQQKLDNSNSNLKNAIEKHAYISGQLGEMCTRTVKNVSVRSCETQRELELMQLVQEERAGAESLREALRMAADSQARLLALRSGPTFLNEPLNISSNQFSN